METRLKARIWKKRDVEKYCKFILGYSPRIFMVSSKKHLGGYAAIAFRKEPEIQFGFRKFTRSLIWHECGHLITTELRGCHWKSERGAHLAAILLALQRGYINIVLELIERLEYWKGKKLYGKARRYLLKDLEEYGVKF